jgi:hypothetical protein
VSGIFVSEPLATYVHDHLAGSAHALDLVAVMRDHYKSEPLGHVAAGLHREISSDRETLQMIADRVGPATSGIKEGAAWLAEKISRMKLQHSDARGLGTFEALEFLLLGIHGKLALWKALAEISRCEARLQGFDFENLMARAQAQEMVVESYRLAAARTAFLPDRQSSAL